MTDAQKTMARQLVLSDLSFREWAEEAEPLGRMTARRKVLDAQMARDKALLGGWKTSHAIADTDLAAVAVEVSAEVVAQTEGERVAHEASVAAELRALVERAERQPGNGYQAELERITTQADRVRAAIQTRSRHASDIGVEGLRWQR